MNQDPDQQATNHGIILLEEIAAKERRLLELRETTRLVERDLRTLKHKWAKHELLRKRGGEGSISVLKPSRPSPPNISPCSLEESMKLGSGKDQQNSDAASASKSPRTRKLFEHGRHMRAISLLSDLESTEEADTSGKRLMPLESSTQGSPARKPPTPAVQVPGLPTILSNSRQIAQDIRGGFLTFLEDIRQVTVGDEVKTGSPRERVDRDPRSLSHAEYHYNMDLDARPSTTKDEYAETAESSKNDQFNIAEASDQTVTPIQ